MRFSHFHRERVVKKTPTDNALEDAVSTLIAGAGRVRREGRLEEVRFWAALQKFAAEREHKARSELEDTQAAFRRRETR